MDSPIGKKLSNYPPSATEPARSQVSTLYTVRSGLHALYAKKLFPTLYTLPSQCACGTPHCTFTGGIHTSIWVLSRRTHFTVGRPHGLPFSNGHCMEPWHSSIVMFRARIYLASCIFAFPFFFWVSMHSKGPLKFPFQSAFYTDKHHFPAYTPHSASDI